MSGELWTVQKVLTWTANRFAERGKLPARLEAEVLLAHVLACTRVSLYMNFDRPLDAAELAAYRELVKRRLGGEPAAYLTGKQEFWSLPLAVDARVLVPRRDSETLVEAALELLAGRVAPRVLDIGTGSGALALAFARSRPDAEVEATDVSQDALAVARANAATLGLERVVFHHGDLAAGARGPFALVLSNPPYIRAGDLAGLQPEVQREPRLALDGGADGLEVYRRLVPAVLPLLAEDGGLALEIGSDQAAAVCSLCRDAGLTVVEVRRDLGKLDRVVVARR